ncbi:MAG: Bax inhibitor-1/YccA family protein [Kofleriaceae bacterium]|nr:Bax inhibitor-1/YccA family protein [Kofleriaceae bacterium]
MSNDQKPPAKTIMGWAPNNLPGQPGQPGQPQQPWDQQPPAAQPPQQWGAPQPPPPAQPWGQQPPMPQAPPPQQWGAPQPPPPAQPWGQQPPMPQAPPPQPWGAQPPMPQQPPQQQWGAPPPQPPPPQQQGWGGPPPQQGPSFGAPPGVGFGGPPQGMPFGNQQQGSKRGVAGADATVGVSARVKYIRLVYLHLFGAILAFTGIEYLLFKNATLGKKVTAPLVDFAIGHLYEGEFYPAPRWHWGVVLAVFTALSFIAHYMAEHTRSKPLHYIGLTIYTIGEALIFVPLLMIVTWVTKDMIASGKGDPNIIRDAAYITLGVFGALTASVFITKKDFSFLRTALVVGGAAAMGLIVLSLVFGFNLGIVFSIAMVLLAVGQILYETSQIMQHDDTDNYVGAALSLFASVALLFWYVIRILLKLRSE